MISLDEDVVFGRPTLALGGAGGPVKGNVLLDEFSVEMDGDEEGAFEECSVGIQTGRAEFDDYRLPFSRGFGSVDERGVAFKAFWGALVIPAVVNGTHVTDGDFRFVVGVEDLDFIAPHEVDAGVGFSGDHELGLDGAVAKFFDGLEVGCFLWVGSVGEDFVFRVANGREVLVSSCDLSRSLPALSGLEDFFPRGGAGREGEDEKRENPNHG